MALPLRTSCPGEKRKRPLAIEKSSLGGVEEGQIFPPLSFFSQHPNSGQGVPKNCKPHRQAPSFFPPGFLDIPWQLSALAQEIALIFTREQLLPSGGGKSTQMFCQNRCPLSFFRWPNGVSLFKVSFGFWFGEITWFHLPCCWNMAQRTPKRWRHLCSAWNSPFFECKNVILCLKDLFTLPTPTIFFKPPFALALENRPGGHFLFNAMYIYCKQ